MITKAKVAIVASGLFIPHISGETDFALERDNKGKIADFRKPSLGLLTYLCVSVATRSIDILFAPLGGSKSLTQRRKDAGISD